ncbi:MAG TPA: hypothetical protein VGG03_01600 [Thermoanaerobaculia bacterium]
MKVATFTVRADARQSARWKQAAQAEGFASAGAWLACAADAYLKVRARAGLPVPLSWRLGAFQAVLSSGETVTVRGKLAPPFAYYEGTETAPSDGRGKRRFTLIYLPTGKPLATLRYAHDCQALGAELARTWVRWGGAEPAEDPGPILDRYRRESL